MLRECQVDHGEAAGAVEQLEQTVIAILSVPDRASLDPLERVAGGEFTTELTRQASVRGPVLDWVPRNEPSNSVCSRPHNH